MQRDDMQRNDMQSNDMRDITMTTRRFTLLCTGLLALSVAACQSTSPSASPSASSESPSEMRETATTDMRPHGMGMGGMHGAGPHGMGMGGMGRHAKGPGERPPRGPQLTSIAIGATAPMTDQGMRNVDGEVTSIGGVAGEHGTLVVFTCNHCPWAKKWEERLTALGNTYRERGVGVIAINPNDPAVFAEDDYATMQERAQALGMQFPYVVDDTSDVARAFGANKTPEVYLLDSEQHLVYHGAIDDSADADGVQVQFLRDALEAVIAGGAIEQAETRAIGCSIKYRDPA